MAEEPSARNPRRRPGKPDFISAGGLALALAGIAGGLLLEGGSLRDIAQFTAAMIVLGGTAGAVMVSTPFPILKGAAGRLLAIFFDSTPDLGSAAEEVIGYATKARKNGLVSLEQEAGLIEDPFLRKSLDLAVDGTDLQEIRKMLELEIEIDEQSAEAEARVFEFAGGYAPTIGIIGAVLGLIQVMKNLANIDNIGHGIAVAFVSTVYGVASANLLFLPAANKIRARIHAEAQRKELILEGVSGIVEGLNPKLIRAKLEAYTKSGASAKKPAKAGAAKASGQTAGAQG
ncbi:MAG TPA: flagellar motor protein [Bryobacteraceae bacterium]|nr:flagellar motor protein [Bryobacteraceae bacterium]